MKKIFYFNTLMFCFLFFTSCHKDDTLELPDQAGRDSIEYVRKCKERCVLTTLCDVEELPDGNCRYTPTYGKMLYSTTPAVRYMVVDDLKEAKRFFNAMLALALDSTETVDMTRDDITYHIESRGSIRFLASSDVKTQIASVKVDFPIVPDLKEIVFIPKERWPHNGSSLLRYGAVYKDKQTDYLFVCIADTKCSDGKLITFDGKKETRKGIYNTKKDYTHWSSVANWGSVQKKAFTEMQQILRYEGEEYNLDDLKMYYGMSSYSDLNELYKFMYVYSGGNRVKNELADVIFTKGGGGVKALFPTIYESENAFLVYGSCPIDWTWSFGWWYFYVPELILVNKNMGRPSDKIKFEERTNWAIGAPNYIPSLCVTVDETFNPTENGLIQIDY